MTMELDGRVFETLNCPFGITKLAEYVIIDGRKVHSGTWEYDETLSFEENCNQWVWD